MTSSYSPVDFEDWPRVEPWEAGFSKDGLSLIDASYRQGSLPNLHGLVVTRHGQVVLERYFEGADEILGRPLGTVRFDRFVLHDIRSVSKSIVALLYGIALAERLVPPPEAALIDQFPEYEDLRADPARRDWTIEDVLTMRLGIEWDESLPYTDPRNGEIAMEASPDRYRFILNRPILEEPGSRWSYCGGATALLGHLIARGAGVALLDYARARLFAPLGIKTVTWTPGSNGEASAAAGLRMRPRDLLKVGQLVLNRGRWSNQDGVPADWLERCFVPRAQTSRGLDYGFHWYVGDREGISCLAAMGLGGQHLFIAPSLDIAFVCTAGNYDQPDGHNVPLVLTKLVLAALR
jgi:CubicO group peptidase (beta-lactamase class C family)